MYPLLPKHPKRSTRVGCTVPAGAPTAPYPGKVHVLHCPLLLLAKLWQSMPTPTLEPTRGALPGLLQIFWFVNVAIGKTLGIIYLKYILIFLKY